MRSSISPYALLQASRPKKIPTVITAYDLYSTAQFSQAEPQTSIAADAPVPVPVPAPTPSSQSTPPVSRPSARTHYIRDIQTRHSTAAARIRPSPPH